MRIESNSRQMPSQSYLVCEKDYCDLLYAWLQCNSKRMGINNPGRHIEKSMVKWTKIEQDFTRLNFEGKPEKVMARKTIAKYFQYLLNEGLVFENGNYYELAVLSPDDASLIEYTTLQKLMNTLQKNSLNIYIYLLNQYVAIGCQPFQPTIRQIKEYIGIATSTTSNNMLVDDTLEILKRLGLIDYQVVMIEEQKSRLEIRWVKNKLPPLG